MSKPPLKIGVVGAGFFGQIAHIANYAQLESCQIVGLAQLRSDVREQVAVKFSIPATFETHHELLANSDAEAIVVVTSRPAMGPVVLDCLNAGRHVLSEKPMAGSVALAERLIAAADASDVRYVIGYMKRHDAGVQAAKRLLDDLRNSNELGAITYVRAHCFGGDAYIGEQDYIATKQRRSGGLSRWPTSPEWLPSDRRAAYENYLNTHCHNINLLRYLIAQDAAVIQAHLAGGTCLATLDLAGIPGLLETGTLKHAGWDEVTEIFFERGRLRIATPAPLRRDATASVELYRGESGMWESIDAVGSWAFLRQAEAFIADLQNDHTSIASAQDAINDLRLTESIWRKLLKVNE